MEWWWSDDGVMMEWWWSDDGMMTSASWGSIQNGRTATKANCTVPPVVTMTNSDNQTRQTNAQKGKTSADIRDWQRRHTRPALFMHSRVRSFFSAFQMSRLMSFKCYERHQPGSVQNYNVGWHHLPLTLMALVKDWDRDSLREHLMC